MTTSFNARTSSDHGAPGFEGTCSRRGFMEMAGLTCACVLGAATATQAWADDKKSDDSWSTARTDTLQTVTDMDGRKVDVKQMPERLADAWPLHLASLCVLNNAVGVVATATTPDDQPWLYKIAPTLREATSTFGKGFSADEVAKLGPDVVFADDDDLEDAFKKDNIPVVDVDCETLDELKQSLALTAQVLGGEAIYRAEEYSKFLDAVISEAGGDHEGVASLDLPKVLYGRSVYTGVVDGAEAFSAQWIAAAGGQVANTDDEDEDETYTVDQLVAMMPDVIITETPAEVDQILNDEAWKDVPAVAAQRVYVNPRGMNSWAACAPEVVLQIPWLASKLYPEAYPADDIVWRAQQFYMDHCYFDLSEDDLKLMLAAQPPAAVNENGLTDDEVAYTEQETAKEQKDLGDIPREGPIDENLPGMEAQDTVME